MALGADRTATYTIQLLSTTSGNAFTNAVTFAAAGLPTGTTATFAPARPVSGTGQATTSTLTITVPTMAVQRSGRSSSTQVIAAGLSLASLLLLWPLRRRRTSRLLLKLFFSLLSTTALSGCGNSSTASTSTITVAATSGATIHTATAMHTIKVMVCGGLPKAYLTRTYVVNTVLHLNPAMPNMALPGELTPSLYSFGF